LKSNKDKCEVRETESLNCFIVVYKQVGTGEINQKNKELTKVNDKEYLIET